METTEARLNPREGQTFAGDSLISRYASFVKLPHTLFALPFAGVGVVLASYSAPVTLTDCIWVVLAFTSARFAAMGFNRIVDRVYDARNPRTQMRELPAGRLSVGQAAVAVAIAGVMFVLSAWQLNKLCGLLSPVALAWVFFYSYTKRFTSFSHYVLGFSLAMAPVGAYLAVTGRWSTQPLGLLLLAAGVTLWVAGFDIVYAIQDITFDRKHQLRSVPARLGDRTALTVARSMHVLAVIAFSLIASRKLFPVGIWYVAGVTIMTGLLFIEHFLMRGEIDMKRIDRAFFQLNVLLSTSFFLTTLIDRLT